jgi:hypothetical protein
LSRVTIGGDRLPGENAVARVSETELLGLIEGALHRSRSKQIPQPGEWERAAEDAAWVVRALQWANVIIIRDERQGRQEGYTGPVIASVRAVAAAK